MPEIFHGVTENAKPPKYRGRAIEKTRKQMELSKNWETINAERLKGREELIEKKQSELKDELLRKKARPSIQIIIRGIENLSQYLERYSKANYKTFNQIGKEFENFYNEKYGTDKGFHEIFMQEDIFRIKQTIRVLGKEYYGKGIIPTFDILDMHIYIK